MIKLKSLLLETPVGKLPNVNKSIAIGKVLHKNIKKTKKYGGKIGIKVTGSKTAPIIHITRGSDQAAFIYTNGFWKVSRPVGVYATRLGDVISDSIFAKYLQKIFK